MRIQWSEVAEVDIGDIYDYIARDVPYYAELFVDKLIASIDTLEAYPEIGRHVPEAEGREDIRELIVQRYRILYQIRTESIVVLAVIHGGRDLAGQETKPWG